MTQILVSQPRISRVRREVEDVEGVMTQNIGEST